MESSDPLLAVRDLVVQFRVGRSWKTAVNDVSLELGRGVVAAVVGESGSGKTTLCRTIAGLQAPSSGHILLAGVDVCCQGRRGPARPVQMVFQHAHDSLDPRQRVGSILREPAGAKQTPESLLEHVGLPASFMKRKSKALSGGQAQRVAIARAIATEPELLILDEPVSSLDVSLQAQILNLLARLQRELGMAYLFVTHDLAVARQMASTIYVMYAGSVVELGDADRVLGSPAHPYTRDLLEAVPRVRARGESLPRPRNPGPAAAGPTRGAPRAVGVSEESAAETVDGAAGAAAEIGCAYRPRCSRYVLLGGPERCRVEAPAMLERSGALVRCHFATSLGASPELEVTK